MSGCTIGSFSGRAQLHDLVELVDRSRKLTIGIKYVQFGMEADITHAHKLGIKCCF
jgi:hypothetical protein